MVPLKIPTPTPAPNRGGPVACLGGPVACFGRDLAVHSSKCKGVVFEVYFTSKSPCKARHAHSKK